MAIAKIIPGNNVVNNGAVVLTGDVPGKNTALYSGQATTSSSAPPETGRFQFGAWAKYPDAPVAASGNTSSANSGADAVINIPAVAGQRRSLSGLSWGYSSNPTSGQISVETPPGTPVFVEPVTNTGINSITFSKPITGATGDAIKVILKDGSSTKSVSAFGIV